MLDVDLDAPPPGVACQLEPGATVLRASHRSLPLAAGLFAMATFWNGVLSVFIAVALAGTLNVLGGPAIDSLPKPEMNGGPMSVGMVVFLWLFLLPFIAIGVGMLLGFIDALAGSTRVEVRAGAVEVFSGVGPIGRRRRFDVGDVRDVQLVQLRRKRARSDDESTGQAIAVEMVAGAAVHLGQSLPSARRAYLCAALHDVLVRRRGV